MPSSFAAYAIANTTIKLVKNSSLHILLGRDGNIIAMTSDSHAQVPKTVIIDLAKNSYSTV